jgi:hypothetical protein
MFNNSNSVSILLGFYKSLNVSTLLNITLSTTSNKVTVLDKNLLKIKP